MGVEGQGGQGQERRLPGIPGAEFQAAVSPRPGLSCWAALPRKAHEGQDNSRTWRPRFLGNEAL